MIKMVVFDLDGTLIDTEPVSINCWIAAAHEMNLEVKREDILTFIGRNPRGIKQRSIELYGEKFPFDEIYNRKKELTGIELEKNLKEKPYATECLQALKMRDIKMCVATSSSYDRSVNFLKKLDLWKYMEFLISGEEVGNSKPDPEIFLKAMEKGGFKPYECIVTEDSFNGITAARRSGATAVLIPDLVTPGAKWQEIAHYTFNDLREFTDWVMDNDATRDIKGGDVI